MEKKCDRCGKKISYFEKWRFIEGKKVLCPQCYEEYEEESNVEKNKIESATFKKNVTGSDLSILELQLQELVDIKDNMQQVRNNVDNIYTILVILFVFFIFSLIASFITLLG